MVVVVLLHYLVTGSEVPKDFGAPLPVSQPSKNQKQHGLLLKYQSAVQPKLHDIILSENDRWNQFMGSS